MKVQKFYVEKDPAPMKMSEPWRYVCTEGEGPFKPHVQGGFKTKKYASDICKVYNNFVMDYIIEQEFLNE